MKKVLLYLFTIFPALVFAQAQTPAPLPVAKELIPASDSFTLDAKVGSTVNSPAKAYLIYKLGANNVLDSTNIVNGAFKFAGSIIYPTNAILIIDHKGIGFSKLDNSADALNLFLEKATIRVGSTTDSVSKAVISGSKINDDNKKLMTELKPVLDEVKKLNADTRAASPAQQQSAEFQNSIQARYKVIQQQQAATFKRFIKENPNSYLSLLALSSLGPSPDPFEMEPLYNSLSPEIRETEMGKQLKASIDELKPTAVGAIAPDFTQADTSGKPVKLSSFRGKYVLLDFWASWCGPCRQENPNVVKAYNHYKTKNFTILGVSLDREGGKNDWMAAIHNDKLSWTQVSDLQFWNNQAAVLYAVKSIPHNFLIDPNGKIIAKDLRGDDLDARLAQIFGKM